MSERAVSLVSRLAAGELVFTAWSAVPDAVTVEALAGTALDAVTLDMQHGGHHEDSVLTGLMPVIAAAKPAIVRVPVGRFDMASRALDFGADAVIAPMINTIEDARRFAVSMKYPPVGERSWGPSFAMARRGRHDSGDWLATANAETLAYAMVETREAFAILDDILALPGIDGIFVGPADFSIAWSGGATVDPSLDDMMAAIETIGRRTRQAGKQAGIYIVDPALTGRFASWGYQLFALGGEHRLMQTGAEALLKAARGSFS